jgi:GTPase Era involved in 16S rRNA processing
VKSNIARGKWRIEDGDLKIAPPPESDPVFYETDAEIKIDSMTRAGFSELIALISTHLPEGPFLYESDYYTDQPMDLRISEVIREQLFLTLGDEIPYACYVEVTQIEEK